jgi:hypothetical protein
VPLLVAATAPRTASARSLFGRNRRETSPQSVRNSLVEAHRSQTESAVRSGISNPSNAVIIAKPAGGVVRDEEVVQPDDMWPRCYSCVLRGVTALSHVTTTLMDGGVLAWTSTRRSD